MPVFHQCSVSDIVHVIIRVCYYNFVGKEPPWHKVKGIILFYFFTRILKEICFQIWVPILTPLMFTGFLLMLFRAF